MVKWAQWWTRPFQKGFLQQWRSDNKIQHINLTPAKNIPPLVAPAGKYSQLLLDRPHHMGHNNFRCQQQGLASKEVSQGRWNSPFLRIVSNILELRVAFQALLAFHHLTRRSSVLLRLDNTIVVAYIRRQGGTRSRSLLREVEPILSWA